jgi:hypothetical protein
LSSRVSTRLVEDGCAGESAIAPRKGMLRCCATVRIPSSIGCVNVRHVAIAVMLVGMASGWIGLNWGDVPAWVGAILTGSSILIASLTYRRSVRDRRAEQLDRERAQAALISTWIESDSTLTVANASNAAVAVRVLFENRLNGKPELASQDFQIGPMSRMVAPSGRPFDSGRDLNNERPGLLIVDSAGAVWLRHSNGKIDRLDEAGRNTLEQELEERYENWQSFGLY